VRGSCGVMEDHPAGGPADHDDVVVSLRGHLDEGDDRDPVVETLPDQLRCRARPMSSRGRGWSGPDPSSECRLWRLDEGGEVFRIHPSPSPPPFDHGERGPPAEQD
jgi:hypothetical protein